MLARRLIQAQSWLHNAPRLLRHSVLQSETARVFAAFVALVVLIVLLWWLRLVDTAVDVDAPARVVNIQRGLQFVAPQGSLQRQPLSRSLDELLAEGADGRRRIIVSESNSGFAPLTDNWLKALAVARPPVTNYLVVALDLDEYTRLSIRGVRVYYNATEGATAASEASVRGASAAQSFFDPAYRSVVFHKWFVVRAVLAAGYSVLLSDVDAVILRSPWTFIDSLPICDAYFAAESFNLFPYPDVWYPYGEPSSFEMLSAILRWWYGRGPGGTGKTGALSERPFARKPYNYVNSGFLYLASGPRARQLVARITEAIEAFGRTGRYDGDQPVLNEVLQGWYERAADAAASRLSANSAIADVASRRVRGWEREVLSVAAGEGGNDDRSDDAELMHWEWGASLLPRVEPHAGLDADADAAAGTPPSPLRWGCAHYGAFTFRVLPPALFQNGKHARQLRLGGGGGGGAATLHWPPHAAAHVDESPYMRHFNFLAGGLPAKVATIMAEGAWVLTREESTAAGLLLSPRSIIEN